MRAGGRRPRRIAPLSCSLYPPGRMKGAAKSSSSPSPTPRAPLHKTPSLFPETRRSGSVSMTHPPGSSQRKPMRLFGQAPTFVPFPAARQERSCTDASRTVYFARSLVRSSRIGTDNEADAWFARSSYNYAAGNGRVSARYWPTGTTMPRGLCRAKPPANTGAAALSIISTIPTSSTSAWNCASTPRAN
jgi:hypothetical protein